MIRCPDCHPRVELNASFGPAARLRLGFIRNRLPRLANVKNGPLRWRDYGQALGTMLRSLMAPVGAAISRAKAYVRPVGATRP
jgi:hypothetical protein